MDNKKKKQVIDSMIDIKNIVSKKLKQEDRRIENITYFEKLDFNTSGRANLELRETYVVKIVDNNKNKSLDQEDQREKTIYEVYDKDNNLIAKIDELGNVKFEESFIKDLKKGNEEYTDLINLDGVEFESDKGLTKEDLSLSKEDLEEIESERKLEGLTEIIGDKKLNSYSEIDTDQTPIFDKIATKQEIDPNVRVTQTETLMDMIPELKQKGIVKIGVIFSDHSKSQNGRFSFIGIDKNGKIQNIESLENTEGTTTGQKVTSINSRDGSVVEEEQVAGMVKINRRNNKEFISLKSGQYGTIEVDYVRADFSKGKDERYLSAPIETKNIYPTTREVRDFMDKSKNPDISDELDRAEPEIERDEQSEIYNIDDYAENDELTPDDIIVLKDGTETTLRKEAGKAKVSPEEFTRRYNESTKKTPDEKIDSIQDEIADEYDLSTRNR